MTDLWVTRRCWGDLEALSDADTLTILERFQERRGLDPDSGETMSGIANVRKLHADPGGGRSVRAVTWHDAGRDVCWLLAAGTHDGFYERVLALHRVGELFPTAADDADLAADAPQRLMRRVVRSARPALLAALASPGEEIPVTETPPPRAFFRVEGDRLWVRLTLYGPQGVPITEKQIAALRAAVFGDAPSEMADPPWLEYPPWHSIYVVGRVPDPATWPPSPRL